MLLLNLNCEKKEEVNLKSLEFKCINIIIQDTSNIPKISFLINVINPNNKKVSLYSNYITNKTRKKSLKQTGFFLECNGVKHPLSQLYPSSAIIISENSSKKILLTYFNTDKNADYNELIKTFDIIYKYNASEINFLNQYRKKMPNIYDYNDNINIKLYNSKVIYSKTIDIEEAIKLTEGKIKYT